LPGGIFSNKNANYILCGENKIWCISWRVGILIAILVYFWPSGIFVAHFGHIFPHLIG
jgi:hypothetical protein